ncbi:fibrous sheath-interacting protein 2 [Alligator mississippiensis]|uniref:fibrous sheath-interacting protein 2 n=1 Tax=Alligator mississippiensis TaxID=8496 RepID=UPI00090759D8|nr:fibrous sheath-interacting protein 2 [Alligator mississippiensis]
MIVEKFPADFGTIEKMSKPPINPPIPVVPVTFVEEILSRFLAKVLSPTDGTSPNSRRHLSRSKVNEIVEDLKEAMEQGLSKHKISLAITEELSDCPFLQAVSDSPATPSQSTMNPGRISNMVLSQESTSEELKTWSSEETIPGSTTNKTASGTEELTVKTIHYIRITHIPIASDLVSDHLRVISLKIEPPEKLKKASIAQTEKCSENASSISEAQRNEDSHFSLGSTGQPVVSREELLLRFQSFSRTSFGKVLKPVLNLLKAFQPKVDLPAQLAAHHTENENPEAKLQWEGEEEIQSIKETIQTESSLSVGSSLAFSMDNEQLSENAGESSAALEAQRLGEWFYDDMRQAWAIGDFLCV